MTFQVIFQVVIHFSSLLTYSQEFEIFKITKIVKSRGGKMKNQIKRGKAFVGVKPLGFLLKLPTYFSLFWWKNSSMINTT